MNAFILLNSSLVYFALIAAHVKLEIIQIDRNERTQPKIVWLLLEWNSLLLIAWKLLTILTHTHTRRYIHLYNYIIPDRFTTIFIYFLLGSSYDGALGNADDSFIAIAHRSTLDRNGSTYRVLSMGQIELSCVLMLNWIGRDWTVLKFKLRTYAKLNFLKLFIYIKTDVALNNQQLLMCHKTKPSQSKQNMFDIIKISV